MTNELQRLIDTPQSLTPLEAEGLMHRYPYFIYPAIAAVRSVREAEVRIRLKQRIAAHIGDTDTLLNLFGADGDQFTDFYPDMHAPAPDTSSTIDRFLNKFGDNTNLQPDPLNFPATPDYAAILEAEEKGETLPGSQSLTDVKHENAPDTESAEIDNLSTAPPHSTQLTESFARLMIKNGNYAKALEIINDLNLNNSEKSVYFADQIRFLKKLILVQAKNN